MGVVDAATQMAAAAAAAADAAAAAAAAAAGATSVQVDAATARDGVAKPMTAAAAAAADDSTTPERVDFAPFCAKSRCTKSVDRNQFSEVQVMWYHWLTPFVIRRRLCEPHNS